MDELQELFRLISNVLLVIGALVGVASVGTHLRVFDRRSPMSRHLLVYMSAIALVFALGAVKLGIGDTWWFQLVRLAAFALVVAAMVQRLYLQIKAQRGTAEAAARRDATPLPPE